jgi:hypothetical protein
LAKRRKVLMAQARNKTLPPMASRSLVLSLDEARLGLASLARSTWYMPYLQHHPPPFVCLASFVKGAAYSGRATDDSSSSGVSTGHAWHLRAACMEGNGPSDFLYWHRGCLCARSGKRHFSRACWTFRLARRVPVVRCVGRFCLALGVAPRCGSGSAASLGGWPLPSRVASGCAA